MFLLESLSSFLPLHNPAGFGGADLFEFVVVVFLGLSILAGKSLIEPRFRAFSRNTGLCLLLLALLPVCLRLVLLANHPVPSPQIYDEFSHLLVADTLLHGRLANPPHAYPQFFETFFVLQEPTYSSIYPLGQAL